MVEAARFYPTPDGKVVPSATVGWDYKARCPVNAGHLDASWRAMGCVYLFQVTMSSLMVSGSPDLASISARP